MAETIVFTEHLLLRSDDHELVEVNFNNGLLLEITQFLIDRNIQSVIVEGGQKVLQNFIDLNLWDEIRVIEAGNKLKSGIEAPNFKAILIYEDNLKGDVLKVYKPNR